MQQTCQCEQNQPVDNQDRPKDRQIEHAEPRADEANGDSLGRRVPEFELRKSPDERSELVVLFCWETSCIAIFHALILLNGWVEFR